MPQGQVPDRFNDILESTTLGHLATVDKQGRPQVNPVWFLWDGEHVLLSVRAVSKKYGNLRNDPHLAISFLDPARPERYVEIRGEVIAFELYEDLTWVNQLARKYTGADYQHGYPGEHRYKLTIQVNSWTGQEPRANY
jgi:PPOX class probable F420-dependent enzyme